MTRTVLLGDLVNIKSGKSRPKEAGEFPVYGGNGIFDSAPIANMNEPAVIVGRVGAYCGSVYIEKDPFWLSDNALGVTAKSSANLGFMYYLLKSMDLNRKSVGGAQPLLTQGILNGVSVTVPDLETQKKIADVLGTIDEKIELNRKMNETLEQMGQALFRHYFIANSDAEKWDVGRIIDIAEVTDYVANGSFASLKANVTLYDEPEYALFVRTTDFKGGFGGNLKYTDKKSYEFLKKSTLFGGEFIISNVGDTGTVFRPPVWLGKPMTLGSNAIMIKDSKFNNYLYQYFRSNEGQFAISNIVAGSAQPKFNKTEFRNLRLKKPDDSTLAQFNEKFTLIETSIISNISQIQTLTTLRDTLLPRLINGTVKV